MSSHTASGHRVDRTTERPRRRRCAAHDGDRRVLAVDADLVGERDQRHGCRSPRPRTTDGRAGRSDGTSAALGANAEPQQQVRDVARRAARMRSCSRSGSSRGSPSTTSRRPRTAGSGSGRRRCGQPEDAGGHVRPSAAGFDAACEPRRSRRRPARRHRTPADARRHGDDLADPDRLEGAPAPRRQQRMRRGDRRPRGRTGAHPEHRLDAVVETRRRDRPRLAALGVERRASPRPPRAAARSMSSRGGRPPRR